MSHHAAPAQVLDRIAALLSAQPDITFATVFGSVAAGTARPNSDLDVGVLADAPLDTERSSGLVRELSGIAGRPVDLVDLHEAGPVVLLSALRGIRLVGRGSGANASLLSRAWTDAVDFLPVRERLLRQRRIAWTG